MNAYDWRLLRAKPFLVRLELGLLRPKHKSRGVDISGRVEAVGGNAKDFHVGGEMFGDVSDIGHGGGFAEYVCVRKAMLAAKPTNLSFGAAAVPMAGGSGGQLA